MDTDLRYMPTFRARQQEMIVLRNFEFGNKIYPLIEIIKEKDRSNNRQSWLDIYGGLIDATKATHVFIDLPVYIKAVSGIQPEVLSFDRQVLSVLDTRIDHFMSLSQCRPKVIPVISSLIFKTGEANTLTAQFTSLRATFPSIAIRTFTNTFNQDLLEISTLLGPSDYLIYDIDKGIGLTSPFMQDAVRKLDGLANGFTKIVLRSAINTDIQNVGLAHDDIVYEADNSVALPSNYKDFLHFDCFGDYVGIKKDDLTAGGTISPGFIFYNPVDNLYYGFNASIKSLDEFERRIVPAVLASPQIVAIQMANTDYLSANNPGWATLQNISIGGESGKSQAKFKKIAMEHYLHTMRVKIANGEIL